MKLAEALQERADLNRNIEQLRQRLMNNAIVQQDEEPVENPQELLKELDTSVSRLEELMEHINRTNTMTTSPNGKSLTALIAHRDCLKVKLHAYKELVNNASQTGRRARMSEIKIQSAVNVREIQKQVDLLSKELRLTDNEIQQLNWLVDLL